MSVVSHPTPSTIGRGSAEISARAPATVSSNARELVSPLESTLMVARGTSDAQMQRRRFLTTPQAVNERPQIITGPAYKSRNSLEYKAQSQHHETVANHKAQPYKEQLMDAYNADRRRVPVSKEHDGSSLRTYFKGMIGSIREPTDAKIFDIEMEMRNAQEAGDTYKMNICRDQISQLEKQYLYDKKLAMKLLMDEKLGGNSRKLRMERDWTGTLTEFRDDVEAERQAMEARHTEEQAQFKEEIVEYAKKLSDLKVSDTVRKMRQEVSQLVAQEKFDEARAMRAKADTQAMEDLREQSPMITMRDMKLDQRLAALHIKQNMEKSDFEHKVESKAVGLAVWRVGMDFVE